MSVRINPSILSADFVNMQHDLNKISTADFAHVDVMDNHFVPNLTFGPQMVSRIQDVSPIPLDVHLMIDKPEIWAPGYAELGCFSVTFHAEATEEPVSLAKELRKLGARSGLAIKPGTAIEPFLEILTEFDQILIMTVEPGFGGQKFITDVMPKLKMVSEHSRKHGLDIWVQVDGGITLDTIVLASENGADTFVAGSSVYGAQNPEAAIAALRGAATHVH
jgi:ribulose-phosphate 3-epimerase